ncbi:MAG TPA: AAA family ATPase [Methanosarcina sp.]|nr:AAA family ATPase [Methanosarcina sp.]
MSVVVEDPNSFLWTEKFRPSTIDQIILPERIKKELYSYAKDGQSMNLLLAGSPGIGKSTISKALAKELGADLMFINASVENGIDTIRNKVIQFASTASFEGNLKIVVFDDAYKLSPEGQNSLNGAIEAFHQNTRFIFTTNFKNKIIDAIQSRCNSIDFSMKPEEKQELTMKAWKRSMEILTQEGVEFDKKTVATIVSRYFPDMRRVLNALQKASACGKVDSTTLSESIPTDALYAFMKEKKFGDVRKWVAQNSGDYQEVFRDIYDQLLTLFVGQSIPQVVILLDMYQDRLTRVADPEITMMACLTEIMATVEWK